MNNYFAATTPGIETLAVLEAEALGIQSQLEPGGIAFKGDVTTLYKANLHMRTASRILARLGNFFYARNLSDLKKRLPLLPWEQFIYPGEPVSIHVTCHKSRLYHSDSVADQVAEGLKERLGKPSKIFRGVIENTAITPQIIVVRLYEDKCTISIDSSGELLHKRGYRLAVAKAPLRENLAAAVIMASAWDKQGPLLDPFCGSGTIPIEAALMANGIPPGLNRQFAFMHWPEYDKDLWLDLKAQAQKTTCNVLPLILASDRDAGAIKMAHENAERAGVERCIQFKCQAVSSISPPHDKGWLVTNPPYGKRISEGKDLRNLYAQLGNVLRLHCPGWHVAVLCNQQVLVSQMQMKLDTSFGFKNGGISVHVAKGVVE